jgi:hypothetical protein
MKENGIIVKSGFDFLPKVVSIFEVMEIIQA